MKKKLFVLLILAALLALTVTPVFADEGDYYNNPGRQQAVEVGAQCGSGASSGAFGWYGPDLNMGVNYPGSNGVPGANGYRTGINNSSVCGNRQGNLP